MLSWYAIKPILENPSTPTQIQNSYGVDFPAWGIDPPEEIAYFKANLDK